MKAPCASEFCGMCRRSGGDVRCHEQPSELSHPRVALSPHRSDKGNVWVYHPSKPKAGLPGTPGLPRQRAKSRLAGDAGSTTPASQKQACRGPPGLPPTSRKQACRRRRTPQPAGRPAPRFRASCEKMRDNLLVKRQVNRRPARAGDPAPPLGSSRGLRPG